MSMKNRYHDCKDTAQLFATFCGSVSGLIKAHEVSQSDRAAMADLKFFYMQFEEKLKELKPDSPF